jgi:uncharacterized protein YlxP (DUF503 family)
MVVGVCELELHIPGCRSLKQKRLVLRRLMDRARHRFNVAVTESAWHDQWQRAGICVVTVSNDAAVVHSILSRVQSLFEKDAHAQLVDVHVELR